MLELTKRQQLDIVTRARVILEDGYVRWTVDDRRGGHCQAGAMGIAHYGDPFCWHPHVAPHSLIEDACRRLHPELANVSSSRLDRPWNIDVFNDTPSIYVNNHLGKEAILDVYDDVIAQLQVAVLCGLESGMPKPKPEPEPEEDEKEREPVPVASGADEC